MSWFKLLVIRGTDNELFKQKKKKVSGLFSVPLEPWPQEHKAPSKPDHRACLEEGSIWFTSNWASNCAWKDFTKGTHLVWNHGKLGSTEAFWVDSSPCPATPWHCPFPHALLSLAFSCLPETSAIIAQHNVTDKAVGICKHPPPTAAAGGVCLKQGMDLVLTPAILGLTCPGL